MHLKGKVVALAALLFGAGSSVQAALVSNPGTLSSGELAGVNAYAADVVTLVVWVVSSTFGVWGVSWVIRNGSRILRHMRLGR